MLAVVVRVEGEGEWDGRFPGRLLKLKATMMMSFRRPGAVVNAEAVHLVEEVEDGNSLGVQGPASVEGGFLVRILAAGQYPPPEVEDNNLLADCVYLLQL